MSVSIARFDIVRVPGIGKVGTYARYGIARCVDDFKWFGGAA